MNSRRMPDQFGFTLVEIMIVVAIIALLAAIAVPGFLRARKRSQATTIKNDLRLIDSAVDQYGLEYSLATGAVNFSQLTRYFKPGSALSEGKSPIPAITYSGSNYLLGIVISSPVGVNALFSDVAEGQFWSPYIVQ